MLQSGAIWFVDLVWVVWWWLIFWVGCGLFFWFGLIFVVVAVVACSGWDDLFGMGCGGLWWFLGMIFGKRKNII